MNYKTLLSLFLFSLFVFSNGHAIKVHERGYWQSKERSNHAYDGILSHFMTDFLLNEQAQTAADFGCGFGDYVSDFLAAGIMAEGFDGNPHTPELTSGMGYVQDLSTPFNLGKKYDWVISLEVGEHIPMKFETNFIENIIRHAKRGIILSWAIHGQDGLGHVNCRNNPYIKKKMAEYGYANDEKAERYLRKNSFFPWFKNTLMVFRAKTS